MLIRTKRKVLMQRAMLEPRIRALLGDRLRAYYAATQHLPLPDRLAEVIEGLAQERVRRMDKAGKAKRGLTSTRLAFAL